MSLFNRLPKDPATRANAMEQLLKQLLGEVQRLWKVMPPEHTGLPSTRLSPLGDPFYTPDPGTTGGGSAGYEYCTLVTPLWRGTSATAILASSGATISVYGDRFGGYGFDGSEFEVAWSSTDSRWYARGAGSYYEEGTVASDIADGASGTVTVRGGKTVTGKATFGAVTASAGMKVGVSWSDYNTTWHIGDARC